QVNVSLSANAALSNPDVSVISGFQIATSAAGFQITPQVPAQPTPIPILTNALPGLNGSYAGATVSLYGSNLAAQNASPTLLIGGRPATILYASASQINLRIPSGLPPGPATMNLNNGVTNAFPVVVGIDPEPATITSLQNAAGNAFSSAQPAHPGDLVLVNLSNFATAGSAVAASRVQVSVGGALHNALQVTASQGGGYQVSLLLDPSDQVGAAQTVIVYLDGHSSYPATLPVARQDGSFTPFDTITANQPEP
ncbi:MAG: IPT/TIG domain-containing protein, partial [Acidobacteriota bacterium]